MTAATTAPEAATHPLTVEPSAEGTNAPASDSKKKARTRLAFIALGGIVAALMAGIGIYVVATRGQQATDDATIEADVVPLAVRVAGTVTGIFVTDNQHVAAGQLLLQLDDAEYAARLQRAEGQLVQAEAQQQQAEAQELIVVASATGGLRSARAQAAGSSAQEATAVAEVAVAQASIERAQAEVTNADTELRRARSLLADGAIPQQQYDTARLASDSAHAGLRLALAGVTAAAASQRAAGLGVTAAQGRLLQSRPVDAEIATARGAEALARGKVTAAEADRDLARLELSYTHVLAPVEGRVSSLTARISQIVAAGQPVAQVVPDRMYVTANFKETQTDAMRVGQRADVSIDAYPHRTFPGRVQSLSAGTGAAFSLLPPDNATGNFVKVVERVPVRIELTPMPTGVELRTGLSVEVTVHEP